MATFISLSIPGLKLKEEKSKQSQAHELLKQCLQSYRDNIENLNEIPELSLVLFIAADVGNVEFLTIRREVYFIAVEKRHESIFNLLAVGSIRDLLAYRIDEDGNNMLHLAAGLAPEDKLNAISGAALQILINKSLMVIPYDLQWKEVEKAVRPVFKEMKNGNGGTPYVLFAKNHKKLRKEGEKWMMNTAKSSMVVATLNGTIAFSYQPDDKLNHQSPKLGLAYSVSSAIAVFCSSTSLITFLSILTSRYSYEDFLVSLPVKLMIGVTTLFISIAAMMVAFSASFCLKNHNHQELPLIFLSLVYLHVCQSCTCC
ncbi:uncharacterized protein LOC115969219 [Quercus lobata]|uniref:uncharacterized protein LOC115969219 n=1 Tax=Quercus lobata TaxID=97700 RepID=UPI0012444646|nr:uncharacterized protein LOC115969219 [Quercus lobata]